jgi:hypothetical protein
LAPAGSSANSSTSPTRLAKWKVIFSRTLCGTSSMSYSFRLGRMTLLVPSGVRPAPLPDAADRQHQTLSVTSVIATVLAPPVR